MKHKLFVVFVGALLTTTAFAQHMKPGLWETIAQAFPEDPADMKQRANMSPAERKKTEEQFSRMTGMTLKLIGGRLTTTQRECFTPEDVALFKHTPEAMAEKLANEMVAEDEKTIIDSISLPTNHTVTVSFTRPQDPPLGGNFTGTLKVIVPNSTSYSLHRQGVNVDGRYLEMWSDSRWLGASCGNVKPEPK